jgi:hypothetical protein
VWQTSSPELSSKSKRRTIGARWFGERTGSSQLVLISGHPCACTSATPARIIAISPGRDYMDKLDSAAWSRMSTAEGQTPDPQVCRLHVLPLGSYARFQSLRVTSHLPAQACLAHSSSCIETYAKHFSREWPGGGAAQLYALEWRHPDRTTQQP